MRILVLCHRLPFPPTKGDKLRSFREIQHLSRRHQIHLLSLADPEAPSAPTKGLEKYCAWVEVFPLRPLAARWRCLKGLTTPRPMTLSYFRSAAMAKRVQELGMTGQFDVMMVCGSAMTQYAALIDDIPKLLDMVDVDSAKWLQYSRVAAFPRNLVWGLEARRLGSYETTLTEVFDKILLTTSEEVSLFQSSSPGAEAVVVRNGVDVVQRAHLSIGKSAAPTLVFTGQMDYFANVDGVVHFVKQVLPRLRSKFPDLRFLIVGRSPTREVLDLARIPGVIVTGEVEEVQPYLAEAWVFVAPLRIAQGVQNKVLEAMAMGIPTVVSARVMSGMADGGFVDGLDLLVTTDDEQTEIAIGRLLASESLRSDLATTAQAKLAGHYSWSANMTTLEQHLEDLVRPAGRGQVAVGAPSFMPQSL